MPTQLAAYSDIQTEELTERISWLIRLRWGAAMAVAATIWLAPRLLGVRLVQSPLYAITAALAAYNLVLWVISRRLLLAAKPFSLAAFANVQIGADLVLLTTLLHFAGGIENPFVCYYVFHIVIASILLSRRASYVHAAVALGLFAAMAGLESAGWLEHYHLAGLTEPNLYRRPIYVLAVVFVVGTMLTFVAFMAASISARLREREKQVVRLSQTLQERAADLESAYDALSQLEQGKSDYLHRVAHHLRSPLAALERMLAVVSEGRTGGLSEKSQELVDRARERVRAILDLARDLLTLSRAREASPLASRRQVNLAEILASVEGDFRQQAAASSISLECAVAPALAPITGDPESLAELLENLISNALKYTPVGGRVGVKVEGKDEQVEISVADSGMGIPAEEMKLIFDEFYRASNARASGQEGTGLGLTIVQAVAQAHGGEVSVESEVGVGTTFRVRLPASPAGVVTGPEPARGGAPGSASEWRPAEIPASDTHPPREKLP